MATVIADTGFVVALANRSDSKYDAVKAIYIQQHLFRPRHCEIFNLIP